MHIDSGHSELQALAEANPLNPFRTVAYARVRALAGHRVVVWPPGCSDVNEGFSAFILSGPVFRVLEIDSAPEVGTDHPAWAEVRRLCSRQRIHRLRIQTFACGSVGIPGLGRELLRRPRREFLLDLQRDAPATGLSTNHRRNYQRAEQSGLRVRECFGETAAETHCALIDQSRARRRARGERVYSGMTADQVRQMLATGAGTVFQTCRAEGPPLSSLLVLLSERAAYYHSAGTSPEGMALGASQFLIANVAGLLRDRDFAQFNLGGTTDQQQGLARFKAGFGARTVELEYAFFDVAEGYARFRLALAMRVRSRLAGARAARRARRGR